MQSKKQYIAIRTWRVQSTNIFWNQFSPQDENKRTWQLNRVQSGKISQSWGHLVTFSSVDRSNLLSDVDYTLLFEEIANLFLHQIHDNETWTLGVIISLQNNPVLLISFTVLLLHSQLPLRKFST